VTDGIIQRDQDLCTGCRRCADNCPSGAIEGAQGKPQTVCEAKCVQCGQCVEICSSYDSIFDENLTPREARLKQRGLPASLTEPLFAVFDRNCLAEVKGALADAGGFAVAQCDRTVATALAEDFGLEPGSFSAGQVAAALRKLGFRKVTNSPAAFSILEEAHEVMERLEGGRVLPVIDSACPAAVKFIEQSYPELLHYLSSCKSPSQVAGALFKSCAAEWWGADAARIFSVSVGPCTSRKFEAGRTEWRAEGRPERRAVDAVLTTRELAYLIKEAGLDMGGLAEEEFDKDLGEVGWLSRVYCTTGDVTQAVFQTISELGGNGAAPTPFAEGPGEGARVTSLTVSGQAIKGLAVSGLRNAVPFFEAIKAGKREFGFIEVRACPQGCVSGGGQPKVLLPQDKPAVYGKRANVTALAAADARSKVAEDPAVRKVYQYFGKACGDKSNHVLNTEYEDRSGEVGQPDDPGPGK